MACRVFSICKLITRYACSNHLPIFLNSLSTERRQILEGSIADFGDIPREKLIFSYSKSSGPGGQNVNKVNTRVEIRFNVREASWIPETMKEKIFHQQKNKLSKKGDLIIYSQLHRSQSCNERDALTKILAIINKAGYVEPVTSPLKKTRIVELQILAKERRMVAKKIRKMRKENRYQFV